MADSTSENPYLEAHPLVRNTQDDGIRRATKTNNLGLRTMQESTWAMISGRNPTLERGTGNGVFRAASFKHPDRIAA